MTSIQSQQNPNNQNPPQIPPQIRLLYKQFSLLFKSIRPSNYLASYNQISQKITLIKKQYPKISEKVKVHLALMFPSGFSEVSEDCKQERWVGDYWNACSSGEQSSWKYLQCLRKGDTLLSSPNSTIISDSTLSTCRPFILLNSLISKYKLGMYQQAMQMANSLIQSKIQEEYAQEVRICTMVKMGMSFKQNDSNVDIAICNANTQRTRYCADLKRVLLMDRSTLTKFLNNQNALHINNWYNLALACKNRNLPNQSSTILQALLKHSKVQQHLKDKCCILLSSICENQSQFVPAIQYLQRVSEKDQVAMKVWELKSKLRLQSVDKQIMKKALMQDTRYLMLQKLEKQLSSFQSHTSKTVTLKSNKQNSMVKVKQLTKTKKKIRLLTTRLPQKHEKKVSQNVLPTFKRVSNNFKVRKYSIHPPILLSNPSESAQNQAVTNPTSEYLTELGSNPTELMTKVSLASQVTIKEEKPHSRGVKFDLSSGSQTSSSKTLIGQASAYEQRIITHIIDSRFQDALDQIKNAENCLAQLQVQDKSLALNFTLKLSKWCRQAGKQRHAILLLRKVMERTQEDHHSYKSLLKELSRNYEDLKQYKNAIEVGLQLIRLGEIEYLDRLGQLHMLRQNYNQALKCYEKYHQIRNNIYSLVKLSHAYSKIPSYSKIAIELLNQILFENKTMCVFKVPEIDQAEDFQSALLLLATIYMNLNGQKKAMEICERYLQQDFGAYPIFYILGILKLREGCHNQAFNCFLSAIRLKPNHLPSLIELLKFLKTNSFEVLSVLRKAFLMHHRDWELLQLLVEAATKIPTKFSQLSVEGLIRCANSLEQVSEDEDLHLETEAVWMWAAELIDEKQKRMSIIDSELIHNVYLHLGDICLNKGNYPSSERYFLRVLQKIQIDQSRSFSKPTPEKVNRELLLLRKLAFLKTEQRQFNAAIAYLSQSKDVALRSGMLDEAVNDGSAIAKIHSILGEPQNSIIEYNKCIAMLEDRYLRDKTAQQLWQKIHLKMGECYAYMKLWKDAKRAYQTILKHKINEQATRRLAEIYNRQGLSHLAKELLVSLSTLKRQES